MKKVLIVGAGVAGTDIYKEVKRYPRLGLRVIGFIDDDPQKLGKNIYGVKVLGAKTNFKEVVTKYKIDEVIIAIPSAHGEKITEYVKLCSQTRAGFKIVPRVKEIIEGRAYIKTVREVKVEDLLGRPVVKSDVRKLRKFLNGKKVLITGAAGSIGSELARQIAAFNPQVMVLFDWWENGLFHLHSELEWDFPRNRKYYVVGSIRDKTRVRAIIGKYKPDLVFHAAAYKHVPLMEENIEEAVKNNIFGTMNVAQAAKENNVKRFILVSTDKAAKPISVMGATKLIAEGVVKFLNDSKTKFMTVRFGNVLDSYGSVIPTFRQQIEKGGPLTITDKRMTRYFMTIPEAAQLILKAAHIGHGGELFVLDMGEPVRIVDLAENLIRLSGLVPHKDIKIIYTGKRRGEKINEQLFNDKEALITTQEEKIFKTESLGINLAMLPLSLTSIKALIKAGNERKLQREINKLTKSL